MVLPCHHRILVRNYNRPLDTRSMNKECIVQDVEFIVQYTQNVALKYNE